MSASMVDGNGDECVDGCGARGAGWWSGRIQDWRCTQQSNLMGVGEIGGVLNNQI